jgi:pyruvate ferredoxin oxidoreductase alpha subunit
MKKEIMTGNTAAAWAARLAKPDFIPVYPITPQTEIIETIAYWLANGEFETEYVTLDSEHSVMSAAIGGAAAGGRIFTATSSQGLELMHEMMYIASGLRLPIVLSNVSRGLSAPITLWADHNDFLSLRDCSWVMFHAQNNQEVLDSLLMAYKISEDPNVLLPSVVNMDGYVLSYTEEPTILPAQQDVNKFLGKYKPKHAFFDSKEPMIQGSAVLFPEDYTYFKRQMHKAQLNAFDVIKKVCRQWQSLTGRRYDFIDTYRLDDADVVLVTQGSMSTTAKAEIADLRKKGIKVGLLRLRLIRPFPRKEIRDALNGIPAVGVVDKNIAPGMGGIMYPEIKDCLYDLKTQPSVSNFITGLGGAPETKDMFRHMIEQTQRDAKKGKEGGAPTCAGCPGELGLKMALKALGQDVVVVNASGCMSLLCNYPTTPLKVSWIHNAIENAAATATGIVKVLRTQGKKTTVLCYAGDGATYDIGFASLSGAAVRNDPMVYVCYNNQSYGNTGVQWSTATPKYAHTRTTPAGKVSVGNLTPSKNMVKIMADHNVYAATASLAYPVDYMNKLQKAQKMNAFTYIDLLAPCPTGWYFDAAQTVTISQLAVQTGFWPLYEIEPDGKLKINNKPEQLRSVKDFLQTQRRFKHLSDKEINFIQSFVNARWQKLLREAESD